MGTGPGADKAVERAAVEVLVAFFIAHFFHRALEAPHAFQLDPVNLQRGEGFAARVLGDVEVGGDVEPDQCSVARVQCPKL